MPESEAGLDGERQEYWESFSRAHEDPWQYDNPYETTKYEQTLALLPRRSIRNALELACAEGHFTARLASRVVCSEVLYYASLEQLAHVPAKLAAALAPDGYLLMAHAHTIFFRRRLSGGFPTFFV